jgi:subtilisin-like proprotein convertase family protein
VNAPVASIRWITVELDITHTWDDDLVLTLVSPAGTRVLLVGGRGGSGDDFTGTVLDDSAANPISSGAAPFTGTFRPEEPLATLFGENANGTWMLEMRDVATIDVGTLHGWTLNFW